MRKITPRKVSENLRQISSFDPDRKNRQSFAKDSDLGDIYHLRIENIHPYKKQARKVFNDEEIESLAITIKENGLRQPITCIKSENVGEYEVVSGERRLRACKKLGLKKIPAIILDDDSQAEEIALIENIQRTDLHIVEFSDAIAELMKDSKYGETSKVAKKIGVSVSKISEALTISKLSKTVKDKILSKGINSRKDIRQIVSLNTEEERLFFIDGKASSGLYRKKPLRPITVKKTNGLYRVSLNEFDQSLEQKNMIIQDLKSIIQTLEN